MKKRTQDLTQEGIEQIKSIVAALEEMGIKSVEEWIFHFPDSFVLAHKMKATEIILSKLGLIEGEGRRIGGCVYFRNAKPEIFFQMYLENNFISMNEMYRHFSDFRNLWNSKMQTKISTYIGKRYLEFFKHITDEEILDEINKKNITRYKDLGNPIFINLISRRKELYKTIGKLFIKRHSRLLHNIYKKDREEFYKEFNVINPENVGKYFLKHGISSRRDCHKKNNFLYIRIFKKGTKRYLEYLLRMGILKRENLIPPTKVQTQLSPLEIGNIMFNKIRDNKLHPQTCLEKIDLKLFKFLEWNKIHWAIKTYILIRFNLILTHATDYMYEWDKQKAQDFLDILGLSPDSELLPQFQTFLDARKIFL